MKKYFAVLNGTLVVPLSEISAAEMNEIKSDRRRTGFSAVPVYWSEGLGVWPHPYSNCIVVSEIKEEEI
jgi:hypothetical protein